MFSQKKIEDFFLHYIFLGSGGGGWGNKPPPRSDGLPVCVYESRLAGMLLVDFSSHTLVPSPSFPSLPFIPLSLLNLTTFPGLPLHDFIYPSDHVYFLTLRMVLFPFFVYLLPFSIMLPCSIYTFPLTFYLTLFSTEYLCI